MQLACSPSMTSPRLVCLQSVSLHVNAHPSSAWQQCTAALPPSRAIQTSAAARSCLGGATVSKTALHCLQSAWWPGNTVMIDIPFPAYPENMGHWAEVLLPLYSVLATREWAHVVKGQSTVIDRLLLVNVRRQNLQVGGLITCFRVNLLPLTVRPNLQAGLAWLSALWVPEELNQAWAPLSRAGVT